MITIDNIIDIVVKYQKDNKLNTLDMCKIMGMKSTSTYNGFIHKHQETKLHYMLHFIKNTGITFEDVIRGTQDSNFLTENRIKDQNSELKISNLKELLALERNTTRILQKHIDMLYEKIEKNIGNKTESNTIDSGVMNGLIAK